MNFFKTKGYFHIAVLIFAMCEPWLKRSIDAFFDVGNREGHEMGLGMSAGFWEELWPHGKTGEISSLCGEL